MGVARPRFRFLALGDSYTFGESVQRADAWPWQMAARMLESGMSVEPTILATTAWTSGELLEALEAVPMPGVFDLVSVQVGVNDQYRGLALDEFASNAESLLRRARQFRGEEAGGVFVVSIPDWGVTPFAEGHDRDEIAGDIDRFNGVWSRLAAAAGLPFVDVTSLSRQHAEELTGDGLHPSPRQYQRWVDTITPVVENLLTPGGG